MNNQLSFETMQLDTMEALAYKGTVLQQKPDGVYKATLISFGENSKGTGFLFKFRVTNEELGIKNGVTSLNVNKGVMMKKEANRTLYRVTGEAGSRWVESPAEMKEGERPVYSLEATINNISSLIGEEVSIEEMSNHIFDILITQNEQGYDQVSVNPADIRAFNSVQDI